jgi:hypothetical protein
VMAAISLAGVVLTLYAITRFRPGEGRATLEDVMAAAASVVHTVPPVAAGPAAQSSPEPQGSKDSDSAVGPPAPPPKQPRP